LIQLDTVYPGTFAEEVAARWREAAVRMLDWLKAMTHPDGGVAFFNDATLGIAGGVRELTDYAASLGIPSSTIGTADPIVPLVDTGYVRLEAGSAVLLADVGRIGPDYLPGHAHADTLSFELSLDGKRLIVNGGISTYEADAERLRQRGTGSHSTVQVDGQDSSEVWSNFRVARRARPYGVAWKQRDGACYLQGSHDGYRRLPGRPLHRREWSLTPSGLTLVDRIDGRYRQAIARFLLHPDWQARLAEGETHGWIERSGRRVSWSSEGAAAARIVVGSWHPGFGLSHPCRVIELEVRGKCLITQFAWE